MKILNPKYDITFQKIDNFFSRGMHKESLSSISDLMNNEGLSETIKFESNLIKYKLNNEAYLPHSEISPVTNIWEELANLNGSSFHEHESYIVSLETAIQLKLQDASLDLINKSDEFKQSLDNIEDQDEKGFFFSELAFLKAMYTLRVKLDYENAINDLTQLLNNYHENNFKSGNIKALYWLGYSYYRIENNDKALEYFNKSLKCAKHSENSFWRTRCLHYLGKIQSDLENWEQATEYLSEAVALYSSLEMHHLESGAMIDLISVLFQLKDFDKIENYLVNRLELAEEFDLVTDYISTSYWLAYLYEYKGDIDKALEAYQNTLEYLNKTEYWDEIHRCSAHVSYLNKHKHDQLPTHLDWSYELEKVPENDTWNVIIVCNGNISRSPYIEFWTKRLIQENHPSLQKKIVIQSMGVLYPNVRMSTLTERYLTKEGFDEKDIEKHTPRYWEDIPDVHKNASIFVTVTGEQAQILNYHYPGKAFMISYIAEEKFENVIDPAIHKADAKDLYNRMKELSEKLVKNLSKLIK